MQQWTQIQTLLRIQIPNDALTIAGDPGRLTDFPVPLLPGPRVAQVFDVRAMLIGTGVVFDAQDRGAAGEHFGDGLDFDLAQTAGFQQICPATVGREEIFERSRFASRRCRGHVSRMAPHRGE